MMEQTNGDLGDAKSRKRRRSSFVNRGKGETTTDELELSTLFNEEQRENLSETERELKILYINKLKKEYKDWKDLFLDTKYKYKETVRETSRSWFFDKSFLVSKEADLLNNKTICRKLSKHLEELIEAVRINKVLRTLLDNTRSKISIYNENEMRNLKLEIYKSLTESNLVVDINMDAYEIDDSDTIEPVLQDIVESD